MELPYSEEKIWTKPTSKSLKYQQKLTTPILPLAQFQPFRGKPLSHLPLFIMYRHLVRLDRKVSQHPPRLAPKFKITDSHGNILWVPLQPQRSCLRLGRHSRLTPLHHHHAFSTVEDEILTDVCRYVACPNYTTTCFPVKTAPPL